MDVVASGISVVPFGWVADAAVVEFGVWVVCVGFGPVGLFGSDEG